MSKFNIRDEVICVETILGQTPSGNVFQVLGVSLKGNDEFLTVRNTSNGDITFGCPAHRFELGKEEPTLEEQLKVAERGCKTVTNNIDYLDEQRRDIASRISDYKSTLKVSREEVDRLKAAIEERDKPKGMVKIGDNIPAKTWLVCAGGKVAVHNRHALNSPPYVAMGNLFYDEESAKQAVHDRKIEVKLKQGK